MDNPQDTDGFEPTFDDNTGFVVDAPKKIISRPRRSVRNSGLTTLLDDEMAELTKEEKYHEIIAEAKSCIGHGSTAGIFPEEWDAQLLIDAGQTADGDRILVFTPAFLKVMVHDERELDRAFKYILLMMDGVVDDQKYIFVYCHAGMDWSNPNLTHRLRVAYDIVPQMFKKQLRRLYILHSTAAFYVLMFSAWPFLSSLLWGKIEYVNSIDAICAKAFPDKKASEQRKVLRRRFPQMVQREDCTRKGTKPPATFGVPLKKLCDGFGVDFTDHTTGRWYPRLPPALVFLCEALERQAADEAFCSMFTPDAAETYHCMATIDEGEPLDPDCSLPALWCTLKLFIDCMPSPLLGEEIYTSLPSDVQACKTEAQLEFLANVLHHDLSTDAAYMALYLSSFLHTMCENAKLRLATRPNVTVKLGSVPADASSELSPPLTEELAAEVFSPGFLRPSQPSNVNVQRTSAARSLVKAFIEHAEDPALWIGGEVQEGASRIRADDSETGPDSEQ